MGKCEIKWCGEETDDFVCIGLNVGDARWHVDICQKCASKLGLRVKGDLLDCNLYASIKRQEEKDESRR